MMLALCLLLFALHFFSLLSAQSMLPLLRNSPGIAATSLVKVEPDIVMLNRFSFTSPGDIPIALDKMVMHPVQEEGTNPTVCQSQDPMDYARKKVKIDPGFHNEQASSGAGIHGTVPQSGIVPYSFFFQSSSKISERTQVGTNINKLANHIQGLISKLDSAFQTWEWWIHQNQALTISCVVLAHNVLTEGGVGGCEKTWVLGIVAALVKNLSLISTDIVNKLQKLLWKHHLYLEIQAAIEFEEAVTQRFKSLLLSSQLHIINQDLEECFTRARLIKSHDEIRDRYFPAKGDGIDEFVSNHLVNARIPREHMEVKSIIRSFAGYFKTLEIPSWEATYARAIFTYLVKYWKNTDARYPSISWGWIETEFDLYRDLHLPFLKKDAKTIFKNNEHKENTISNGIITYNELIDPAKDVEVPYFFSGIDNVAFPHAMQADMYKLTVIGSLVHPELEDFLVEELDRRPQIMKNLAPFLLQMYPSLEVGTHDFFEYQYQPFKSSPHYFAIIHRQLLSEKMSKFASTKSLGNLLEKIPQRAARLGPQSVQILLDEVDHILHSHEEHNEIPKVYLMALEAVLHVVRYHKGAAMSLLKKLEDDMHFRTRMDLSIKHVLDAKIYDGHITQVNECVLKLIFQPFLSKLYMIMTDPQEDKIIHSAEDLEIATSPKSVVTLGNFPDPPAEALQWLNK